eukprot:COSAG05_NODE_20969_length_275_cov_0.880682_1_plen_40_part_10
MGTGRLPLLVGIPSRSRLASTIFLFLNLRYHKNTSVPGIF